ncbi:zinc finger protein 260-like [Onthophagus taurus]|uniref:zinc finger protein 260-like n=1 Tax=Onthophagus taurus TaxID=166361 RepID=UPI0039BE46DE
MEIIIELPQDINKLCRTCMDIVKSENKRDIFTVENEDLLLMLKNVICVKISAQDGLPKYLCGECVKKLEFAYSFKQQCEDTYINFKGFLNPNQEEQSESTENTLKLEDLNKFICVVCSERFPSQYSLSRHEITHDKSKSLTSRFESSNNTEEEQEYDEKLVGGDVLELIDERKNNGIQRMEIETIEVIEANESTVLLDNLNENNGVKTCDICNREYPDHLTLCFHFINHALLIESDTDPDIFQQYFFCDCCGETFETKSDIDNHMLNCFSNKMIYKCDKCEIQFKTDIDLLKHDEQEHKLLNNLSWNEVFLKTIEKNEFVCPICTESFATKHALTVHSVKHVLKQVTCRICKKTFCSQIACNNHLKIHPNYKHVCERCGRCLGSRHALKTHIMGVHSTSSNYVCTVCSKKFKTPSRLYIHKLIHKKDKKYDCRLCGYKTNNVGDLKVHNRIHTLERPYKCNFVNCNRMFKTSSHLNEHIQRHLQIKKYQCDQCQMVFGHQHTLKMHIMVHTGEKPFNCEVCGLKFRRKHHLKNHMKQHEPQEIDEFETININI